VKHLSDSSIGICCVYLCPGLMRKLDSFLTIPRVFADGDSIEKLEAKIRGVYEPVGWWQGHVPRSVMRIVSPDDFKRRASNPLHGLRYWVPLSIAVEVPPHVCRTSVHSLYFLFRQS
jgi:hypothetical protein